MNHPDQLTDDELSLLERTELGRRAAAEIRIHRASEPGPISLAVGFVLVVVVGLAALSTALKQAPACPVTTQAPTTR